MVRSDVSVSQRRHRRFIFHILPLSIVAVCSIALFFSFRTLFSPISFRQTVVIVSDPVFVVSFDAKNRKVATMEIPLDTVIPAAMGYGRYSMRSLISLDDIDHHSGALITSSVSNALGVPISGYLSLKNAPKGQMNLEVLRTIFSFGSIVETLANQSHRSVPWSLWVRLVGAIGSMSVDAWHPINITGAIVDEVSPDGSRVPSLDESRVDYIIDTALYDGGIRSEGTSVAVYNTTDVASVGLRASRQLSRVGMQLIYVGNSDTAVERCAVLGSDEVLKTKTARFIREYYDCDLRPESDAGKDTGADMVVLLGTDFAEKYK